MNGGVAVLSSAWLQAPLDEMGFAMRSIAGALSRLGEVDVLVPGPPGTWADGGFDVTAIGAPRAGRNWPDPDDVTCGPADAHAGAPRERPVAVIVETGDEDAHHLAAARFPGSPVVTVGARRRPVPVSSGAAAGSPDAAMLAAVDLAPHEAGGGGGTGAKPRAGRRVHPVGLYTRVHAGAFDRRHYGLRSVPEYVLVLGDRTGAPLCQWPSEHVRWVLARFARRHVVVVEGAEASVWRSRSNVGHFGVHTRMDLWLLMAHARGVVDLMPGTLFARECVEALRYGVPVVAPAGSSAAALADAGGALCFSSTAELLSCVDALGDPVRREALSDVGRAVADRWYGDPDGLVDRLASLLETREGPGATRTPAPGACL